MSDVEPSPLSAGSPSNAASEALTKVPLPFTPAFESASPPRQNRAEPLDQPNLAKFSSRHFVPNVCLPDLHISLAHPTSPAPKPHVHTRHILAGLSKNSEENDSIHDPHSRSRSPNVNSYGSGAAELRQKARQQESSKTPSGAADNITRSPSPLPSLARFESSLAHQIDHPEKAHDDDVVKRLHEALSSHHIPPELLTKVLDVHRPRGLSEAFDKLSSRRRADLDFITQTSQLQLHAKPQKREASTKEDGSASEKEKRAEVKFSDIRVPRGILKPLETHRQLFDRQHVLLSRVTQKTTLDQIQEDMKHSQPASKGLHLMGGRLLGGGLLLNPKREQLSFRGAAEADLRSKNLSLNAALDAVKCITDRESRLQKAKANLRGNRNSTAGLKEESEDGLKFRQERGSFDERVRQLGVLLGGTSAVTGHTLDHFHRCSGEQNLDVNQRFSSRWRAEE